MIVFVILHYKNIKDTFECIESIKNLRLNNYKIVIVENGSLDSSSQELKLLQNEVDIVFNDINYGFAKGNNTGISYAKNKYNPDYYFVINNDIILKDKSTFLNIYKMEELHNFDVLGPKILARDGINQNPNFLVLHKNIDITKHLLKMTIIEFFILINLYTRIKKYNDSKKISGNKISQEEVIVGAPLHGSALIFSKRYIEKYKEPFDESTFLYGEEEFLYYRKKRDNLKFVYTPNITVFHKEDAALNELFKDNNIKKIKFVIKHSKKSLIKLMQTKLNDKIGGHKYE